MVIQTANLPSLIVHIHPEIGYVADDNGGAQSSGCCYDHGQQPGPALEAWLDSTEPGQAPILDAALASDGWWWRVIRPYQYGLGDMD